MIFSRSISKPSLSAVLCLFLFLGPGCLAKGTQTGIGSGLSPLVNPSPGGMAGPEVSSPSAAMGGPQAGTTDAPSEPAPADAPAGGEKGTFTDTPITVVGQPSAVTPKNPECMNHRQVRTCFRGIAVKADGLPDSDGRPLYRVSGEYIERVNDGPWIEVVTENPLAIFDLSYPESPVGFATIDFSGFQFVVYAPAGRPVRLEAKHCGRIARVDFELPDPSEPLFLNPCDHPDVADFEDPDYTAPEEEAPPDLPTPPGPLWVEPFHRDPLSPPVPDVPIDWEEEDLPMERKAGFGRPKF